MDAQRENERLQLEVRGYQQQLQAMRKELTLAKLKSLLYAVYKLLSFSLYYHYMPTKTISAVGFKHGYYRTAAYFSCSSGLL